MSEAALLKSRGTVAGPRGAAAKLGIPASTLESKIKRLGSEDRGFRRDSLGFEPTQSRQASVNL
jgi:formate hydrogenlyase transcriptional activator